MKKKIFIIGGIILTLILGSLLVYKLSTPKKLGLSVVTDYQKTLRISMTAAQDYVPVTSLTLKDDTVLDMSKFGDKVFLTIEPGKDKEEIVMCTGINTSSLNFTSCTRGLAFSGTSTATVAGLSKTHSAGSNVTISNVHYVYDQFVSRFGNQLIFGDQTSTTDKLIIFDDGTATSTAIKWDAATNQLLFRRMGDTSYRVMPTQLRGTYADYASLPSTGNSEGDIAITTDDSKLYVWDDSGSTWVLAGGSSGAGTVYKTEKVGSESDGGDLKTFSLTSGSWPDEKFLLVYKNGQLQRIGATNDYTEVDSDTIEFTYTLASDDLITMIVVSIDLYNPAWGSVTEDIVPDADNTHSLGSILKTWKNFFTKTASSWNWATTTPTAGYVPIASSTGKINENWIDTSNIYSGFIAGEAINNGDAVSIVSSADTVSSTLSQTQTNTTENPGANTNWKGQIVLLPGGFKSLKQVVWGSDFHSSRDYVLRIRGVNGEIPTGADIASTTATVSSGNLTFTFSSPVVLTPLTKYAFIVTVNVTNTSYLMQSTDVYADGSRVLSSDSGSTWATTTGDYYFSLLYYNASGFLFKSNSTFNDALANKFVGFSSGNYSYGQPARVRVNSVVEGFSNLIVGENYYLSNTSGIVSSTAGTISRKIGLSVSSTAILIKHDNP